MVTCNVYEPYNTNLKHQAWKELLQRTRLPSRELCAWLHLAILGTPNLVVRTMAL
jgi:hypothetical protein